MTKNVYAKLEKRVAEIEKRYQSLENFVTSTTIFPAKHRMRMEDIPSTFKEMSAVYLELEDLTLADLSDFQKLAGLIDGEHS